MQHPQLEVFREANNFISDNIEFVSWIQRNDGLCVPLQVTMTHVGALPGMNSAHNPRAFLELKTPEVSTWVLQPTRMTLQCPGSRMCAARGFLVAHENRCPLQAKEVQPLITKSPGSSLCLNGSETTECSTASTTTSFQEAPIPAKRV